MDEFECEESIILEKFMRELLEYEASALRDLKRYTDNPSDSLSRAILDKYPYVKRDGKLTKRKRTILTKPYVHEILQLKRDDIDVFTPEEKRVIITCNVKKIKPIYKHAQAWKTGYCNMKIINGFSIDNFITVCITKDNLEANEQWLERLYKELDNCFPHTKLEDKIMLISSKKNTLNGNATHCKDMKDAWALLKRANEFKVIFVCSNKTRIRDILEMSLDFQNLRDSSLRKNIQILHDEAHNTQHGIPAHRDIIENIIVQPNVLYYIPVSASPDSISDDDYPLWLMENLEKEALNYTHFDKTKSTDENYSSCNDSIFLRFEEMKRGPKWRRYGIKQFPLEIFEGIHENDYLLYRNYNTSRLKDQLKVEIDLFKKNNISTTEFDIDTIGRDTEVSDDELISKIKVINMERRRTVDFCQLIRNYKEAEAVDNGLNVLHINEIMEQDIIQSGKFGIYIISTPKRKVLTAFLAEEARKMSYNPIVLGIYGNEGDKYNLYIDGELLEVSAIMDKGEFNCKLDNLFQYIKSQDKNMDRPFFIIGNYVPTGESLTFVNYTYGTVRCNIRLISTSAEEDYQQSARSNYMTTKFIEKYPGWTPPEKFLIGPCAYIDNALYYEAANDTRIDHLISRPEIYNGPHETVIMNTHIESQQITGGIVAVPMKIVIDRDYPLTRNLVTILEKPRRSNEDKKEILRILQAMSLDEESGCDISDPSKKFNFETYTLKDARSYKKKEGGPKAGEWKFASYMNHYDIKTPFINDRNNIDVNECELLSCIDTYILKDKDGNTKEKNTKSIWWMGYKYVAAHTE